MRNFELPRETYIREVRSLLDVIPDLGLVLPLRETIDLAPHRDGDVTVAVQMTASPPCWRSYFIKPTDMIYDGSADPHIHLNDFEHRMICDGTVDENEFTISRDNTKHPINLLAVIQKPNETTRKFIKRFNAECKIIDGLVDGVASLCLTNGLANDEFRKLLMTKPVWTRKEMQVIAKEFIHREEVNRVVAATKNPQTHTAPGGHGQVHHPRDNQRETESRGNPKPPKQKFDNYIYSIGSFHHGDLPPGFRKWRPPQS
ncbi:hypothetical protein PIB30_090972 [Stylosanthes scabra]|uniref:Uncharacterized protein n=1 Tax=Stylosanthes scabra TaxID=79078 RepID=A0ABU6XWZ0_9FABA|nr:hypothetical protein [Stylosanthes scabra]